MNKCWINIEHSSVQQSADEAGLTCDNFHGEADVNKTEVSVVQQHRKREFLSAVVC